MGITRLVDITGLDSIGIPVYMAVRPNSRTVSVSQGKGVTPALAKASAAMESIESYHAEIIDLPVIRSSYNELCAKNQLAADPARMLFTEPDIYTPDLDLFWIQGTELLSGQEIWVPHDAIALDFTTQTEGGFFQNSNGLASGNHLMEAISHAICEVVERDATAFYKLSLNDSVMPLDLNSVDSELCQQAFSVVYKAGFELYVMNITHEIGIPTFQCNLVDPSPASQISQSVISKGYGTHLSKEIALLRAVTEAIQSRLTVIAGSRDDLKKADYAVSEYKSYQGQGIHQVYSMDGLNQPGQDYADIPSLETESLDQDVQLQLEMLQKNGIDQVLMVDLTRPEFNIPVVHVLIPGMEYLFEGGLKYHFKKRTIQAKVRKIMNQLEENMQ